MKYPWTQILNQCVYRTFRLIVKLVVNSYTQLHKLVVTTCSSDRQQQVLFNLIFIRTQQKKICNDIYKKLAVISIKTQQKKKKTFTDDYRLPRQEHEHFFFLMRLLLMVSDIFISPVSGLRKICDGSMINYSK